MNSYTNDPLSRMTSQEIEEAQVHLRCDFCSVNVPEYTMQRIDGYRLCQDCYDQYCSEPDIEDEPDPDASLTSWDRKHFGLSRPEED